jgi:hypothetical protein
MFTMYRQSLCPSIALFGQGRRASGRRHEKLLLSTPAVAPEPISPELVLVDPELARRERARLEERAYLQSVLEHAVVAPPPIAEPAPVLALDLPAPSAWRDAATFAKRRLVPAALLCSLLANGFLVADLVARRGEEAAQVAVRMVTLTQSRAQSPPTAVAGIKRQATRIATPPAPAPAPAPTTKRTIESKVVSLIVTAPANKLPRDFIDPATGLVKNNVHVVCTKRQRRSFLCAIRLPSQPARRAIYVRYRLTKDGQGVFRWSGYRKS